MLLLYYMYIIKQQKGTAMIIKLPEQVNTALNLLSDNGFEGFIVGGCVRDCILGITPYDWDITTNATPAETENCFKDYKIIETGFQHGTVTVLIDKIPLEITTYRIDGEYFDCRRPESVTFSRNLKDDLSRRDFTVNTLCYNQKDGLIDLFGGIDDINNKIIRCVGEPDKRFSEDALRIMRGIRFSATLGFKIDKSTADSIRCNRQLLTNISFERIRVEFNKLICGKNATEIIRQYSDVFGVFIPELLPLIGCEQKTKYHKYDVFEHTLVAVDNIDSDDLILRLTMLFHDFGKPQAKTTDEKGTSHFKGHAKISGKLANDILKRLKYDNKTINEVTKLVLIHDMKSAKSKIEAKHMLNHIGDEDYLRLIKIKRADNRAKANPHSIDEKLENMLKFYNEIKQNNECYTLNSLDISGNDIISLGKFKGTEIKSALDFLLNAVIDENCLNKKGKLIKYFEENYNDCKES